MASRLEWDNAMSVMGFLKAGLGLDAEPVDDTLAARSLRDLGLPLPDSGSDALPVHHDAAAEAAEILDEWAVLGHDLTMPLPIVFETVFDDEAGANAFLATGGALPLGSVVATQVRPFGNSFATTFTVSMMPEAPAILANVARLEAAAAPSGGRVDGYYLPDEASL
jgi:hypothetical protein